MEKIVLIVHLLAAIAIIALILLQQGKGATAGASFGGGASQTVFGSEGSGNFFTRATSLFALVFFCTSFGLAIMAKNSVRVVDSAIPTAVESVASDIPTAEAIIESDIPSVESDMPVIIDTAGNIVEDLPEVPATPQ